MREALLILIILILSEKIFVSPFQIAFDNSSKVGSFLKIISGHLYELRDVIEIKNGLIASLGDDMINIWDLENGLLVRKINGFGYGTKTLTLLRNGNIAGGSLDKTVKIWDPYNGKLVKTLYGHSDIVIALCVTPKGYLVSGSDDSTIKIWNPINGTLIRTLEGHDSFVRAVIALPNGNIVSGSRDKTFKIWNPDNGELIKSISTDTKIPNQFSLLDDDLVVGYIKTDEPLIEIWSVKDVKNITKIFEKKFDRINSFTAYNFHLIVASDNQIEVWKTTNKQMVKKIPSNYNFFLSVHLISNNRLLSCMIDKTIKVWDINKWNLIRQISAHTKPITTFTILPNGNIATASNDLTIIIWNAEKESMIRVINSISDVSSLATLENVNLVSGSNDGKIRIWNLNNGSLIKTINAHKKEIKCILAIDNDTIASGSADATIKIWSFKKGTLLKTMKGHDSDVSFLALSQENLIVSSSYDTSINIWNQNGLLLKTLSDHENIVNIVQIFKNGHIASGSSDSTIKIWDPKNGALLRSFVIGGEINSFGILSNNNIVVFKKRSIDIIDGKNGSLIKSINPLFFFHFQKIDEKYQLKIINDKIFINMDKSIQVFNPMDESFAKKLLINVPFSTNPILTHEKYMAVGGENSTILLIDVKNEKIINKISTQNDFMVSIIDLGKDKIVAGFKEGIIKVWNKKTGNLMKTLNTTEKGISSIVLIDNEYIAILSDDGKVQIWNVEKGTLHKEISEKASLEYICSIPNDQLLTFSNNNSVKLWNTKNGQLIKTLSAEVSEFLNYEYSLLITSFPNGFFAIARSFLQIFDSKTGQLVCFLEGHTQKINTIKILKNGLVATGSNDKTIKIWNLNGCFLVKTLIGDTSEIMWLDELEDGVLIAFSEGDLFLLKI